MKSKYQDYTDEALVDLSRLGDNEAEEHLIRRYKEVVRAKTRIYFIVGADEEDVAQEGMIGIFKAIKSYDPEKKASFRTFAELCINRQIMPAIKTANRQKHTPLNQSVSLSKPIGDGLAGVDHRAAAHCQDKVQFLLQPDGNAFPHFGEVGIRDHAAQLRVIETFLVQ